MYVPDVEFHACVTLEDAGALLTRHAPRARVLAGGTDLLVDLKTGRASAQHLVSISRIDSLRGVWATAEGLRIGALTSITRLHHSSLVRERWAPLRDATGQMAAPQIRNMATVGGNIACAVPCADLPPILTVLNAEIVAWSSRGERRLPLPRFFLGPRRTAMEGDEILTAVVVPPMPAGFGAAYARFALREGNAIAVAAAAAGLRLDAEGRIADARLTLGAVAPVPQTVQAAQEMLVGHRPDEPLFDKAAAAAELAARPISDVRGSAEFRRKLVGVLTRRALHAALRRAREATS